MPEKEKITRQTVLLECTIQDIRYTLTLILWILAFWTGIGIGMLIHILV